MCSDGMSLHGTLSFRPIDFEQFTQFGLDVFCGVVFVWFLVFSLFSCF